MAPLMLHGRRIDLQQYHGSAQLYRPRVDAVLEEISLVEARIGVLQAVRQQLVASLAIYGDHAEDEADEAEVAEGASGSGGGAKGKGRAR